MRGGHSVATTATAALDENANRPHSIPLTFAGRRDSMAKSTGSDAKPDLRLVAAEAEIYDLMKAVSYTHLTLPTILLV